MKCKYHPNEDGVATCAKCGVALCNKCESEALYRTDNGKGQAYCKRCTLEEVQAIVNFEENWLKKRKLKLKIMGAVIALSFVIGLFTFDFSTIIGGIFFAGVIANVGLEPAPKSLESIIYDANMKVHHPTTYYGNNALAKAISGPIIAIACFISYNKTKQNYQQHLSELELAKMHMMEE